MTRRMLAEQADELYSALEQIAHDFRPDGEPIDTMLRYELVLTALMYVMRKSERSSLGEISLLLESFQGLLQDIRDGRPSLADRFPRTSGQRIGSQAEIDLAICCAVMTGWINGGMGEREAARKLAIVMEKRDLKFPPARHTARSKSDTTSPADKMMSWRDKLMSGKKGVSLRSTYDKHLNMIKGSTQDEWHQNATDLLEIVGRRGS